ncbi:MAG TPA: S41 family peptidase [Gemmatimonadaceae bacterium]
MNARVVAAATALVTSLVGGGWVLARGLNSRVVEESGASLFDDVMTHVRNYYVDSIPDSVLFENAMVGMLRELDDPYSLYLAPRRLDRLTERTSGSYIGIGAQIQRRDRYPMIIAPFPGSPAERAGLRTGDRVVEVDSANTRGWTSDEAARALRGPPGSTVAITIERPGQAGRLTIQVTRSGVHRRAVARRALVNGTVGYVDVNVFNDSTARELRQAVDSLVGQGMKSLIMDLRGNPGGVLSQGVGVADMFLDRSQLIVSLRGRGAAQQVVDSAPQPWPDLPVVVLVDGGSASASEIVAGALQDHDRALIMGRRSFGKGSAQSIFTVASGGGVKITTARWYTPSGRSIGRPRIQGAAPEAAPPAPLYSTDHGRQVQGGGGIVPDTVAGDTALSPGEQALEDALGSRVIRFRDAMVDVAMALKARNAVRRSDFDVTRPMLDELWSAMRDRGIRFDRAIFDGATPLVSRLLAREIARYAFGPEAEAERSIRDDEVIQAAARLATGVESPDALLARVQGAARRQERGAP